MSKTFFHADDFGVSLEQSKNILSCYKDGVLNSVSIIPNSPACAQSYTLIDSLVKEGKIRLVIHLNFVEGHSMADPSLLPHLVDANGNFICSYGSMLKLNYSSQKSSVYNEFKAEIAAQIKAITDLTGSKTINVDSHQHYLQIPMIFNAFFDVVKEEGYTVEYLRNPVDPLSPIWSTPSLFFNIPLINHVKWMLLSFLAPSKRYYKELACKVPVFFGMPFTCQMTLERVSKLLPKYQKVASKQKRDLELMFHPGAVYDSSLLLDATQADLVDFYSSDFREKENKCLKSL